MHRKGIDSAVIVWYTLKVMKSKQPKTNGRFYINKDDDGYTLVDDSCAACISFDTRKEANAQATFVRAYVKKWGDISLHSYPSSMDDAPTAYGLAMNICDEEEKADELAASLEGKSLAEVLEAMQAIRLANKLKEAQKERYDFLKKRIDALTITQRGFANERSPGYGSVYSSWSNLQKQIDPLKNELARLAQTLGEDA